MKTPRLARVKVVIRKAWTQWIINTVMILLLILMLYPLAFTAWCAFKGELAFMNTRWYPTLPLREANIGAAWSRVAQYIFNTIFVAVAGTCGLLIQSSVGAFVFSRFKFPGKEVLFALIISLMFVPGVLTLVPSYLLYHGLGLTDSYWVLILPQWVAGPVFGIFLLRQFFIAIPEEIFDAGKVDGCSRIGLYWRLCLPLSIPIIGTLAVMNTVGQWNDLLWPLVTIHKDRFLTIAAGLATRLAGDYTITYPIVFSGYLLASVPLIVLFAVASKYYVEGLTSSALKF